MEEGHRSDFRWRLQIGHDRQTVWRDHGRHADMHDRRLLVSFTIAEAFGGGSFFMSPL
jgi:hypothetical protein